MWRLTLNILVLGILGSFGSGCVGSPVRDDVTRSDQDSEATLNAVAPTAPAFESSLKLVEGKDVSDYLERLATRLAKKPSRTKLFNAPDSKWQSFSSAGPQVYMSVGVLKASRYESEVAAALAFELGFVERGIQHAPDSTITSEHRQLACEEAISMLYSAGIDPRGLSALLDMYERYPKTSPIPSDEISELQESVRAGIARHAPLMNPIVRSPEYAAIRKKLERL